MNNILVIGGSGYVGNALVSYLSKNFNCHSIDIKWFDGPDGNFTQDYNTLSTEFLNIYSHVILLAGHSSMAMCEHNWQSAWQNNIVNLASLIGKLNKNQVLIYASSGSVYGNGGLNRTENMNLASALVEYDLTKQLGEQIATGAICKTVGLRFGTLSGFANYARSDLMLNAMVISAKTKNNIDCYNGHNHRSILGINDCNRAIETIINQTRLLEQHDIFNLASFSGTIETFANITGQTLNVPVNKHEKITNTFSFALNCNKFIHKFNFSFNDTAQTIISELIEKYDVIKWSPRTKKVFYA
jgi:nucleoside-diphosphate-sugar epimerase